MYKGNENILICDHPVVKHKITMLRNGFNQFLNDAENKIMFQRPENLNPTHEEHGQYNQGWNDCSSRWIDIIHNFEKENVTIPECQGDEG